MEGRIPQPQLRGRGSHHSDRHLGRPFADPIAEEMLQAIEKNTQGWASACSVPPPLSRAWCTLSGPNGAYAARHDDLLRRLAHGDPRRIRRAGVRHRHLAGARRARDPDAEHGQAEGAPHRGERQAASRAFTPRT